jgi:opacity protein-like surface antigen
MVNKKLLAVVSLTAAISTSSAFAKTQGHYVGVDLIATKYKDINIVSGTRENDVDYGVGINYKYAINFNNFFVAPGVFYNYNNAELQVGGGLIDLTSGLKNSYGVKADFGYDVTDKFAPFVSFGYQENRIEVTSSDFAALNGGTTLESLTYGVGAKYSVMSNVDVSLVYEYVNYNKSVFENSLNIDVVKLGASYRF